jgi:glycerol-3-phosphate dehydrogenase
MKLRESNIEKLPQGVYDVLIIGGGINGAVSAAALSGKGARVALIDQRDFAGFTSQNSVRIPRTSPGAGSSISKAAMSP